MPPPPPSNPPAASTATAAILAGWLLAAIALTAGLTARHGGGPYRDPHAWMSAHASLMAHSFAAEGLPGAPTENYPPHSSSRDTYLHWPPLFFVALGSAFRALGESEAVGVGFMLVVLSANALGVAGLVAQVDGRRAGLFAGLAYLCLPVAVGSGRLICWEQLAITCLLLALNALVRASGTAGVRWRWAVPGLGLMALAIGISWEPTFAAVGLVGVGVWSGRRDLRALGLIALGLVGVTIAAILALYCVQHPHLVDDLRQTVAYRAGLAPYKAKDVDLHALTNQRHYQPIPIRKSIATIVGFLKGEIGEPSLACLGWLLARGWFGRRDRADPRAAIAMVPLLTMPALWSAAFAQQMGRHEFMMFLLAPAAAGAAGMVFGRALEATDALPGDPGRRASAFALGVVLPAVLVVSLGVRLTKTMKEAPTPAEVLYGRAIEASTAPGCVVLIPSQSMVPVYYSRRHCVRGIDDDPTLRRALPQLAERFPGVPTYLALTPRQADSPVFAEARKAYPTAARNDQLLLLRLPTATTPAPRPATAEALGHPS